MAKVRSFGQALRAGLDTGSLGGAFGRGRRSGGSVARGTSTYSRPSQFRIAQAAARKVGSRGNRAIQLYYNKRTGLYENTSEARRG